MYAITYYIKEIQQKCSEEHVYNQIKKMRVGYCFVLVTLHVQ